MARAVEAGYRHIDTAAIPRTSNPSRLVENTDLFDFAVSDGEMEAVSALRSARRRICD